MSRWAQGVALAAACCLGAAAIRNPAWAMAGWASVALLAAMMTRWKASLAGVAGLVLGGSVAAWLAMPWLPGAFTVAGGEGWVWLAAVPTTLVWATLSRLPVAVAWVAFGRRAPVWLWLPPAWIIGEAWLESAVHLMLDAWLYGQWQVEPVLRALALVGWVPTLAGCLLLASALGAAAAGQRHAWVPAALMLAFGLALPARPTLSAGPLATVGAVHMASPARAPQAVSDGLTLLVWPEHAAAGRPRLAEGPVPPGRRLPTPLMRSAMHQLFGAAIQTPDGPMNAIAALAPDGRVEAVRGKRDLFPLVERPFLGMLAPGAVPYTAGRAPVSLPVGARRVGAVVCLESFDRALVAEARAAGATLIAISASDELLGGHPVGDRQMLGLAVLRAVESRLPVVRASVYGRAALVGADGRVLAWSEPGETGVLTLNAPR